MKKYKIKKAIENNNFEEVKKLILEGFEEEENKKYFCGHELSNEEIKRNRVSYRTFASCFDAVLCNNITEIDPYIFDNVECGNFEFYEIDGEYLTPSEKEEKEEEIRDQLEELENNDNCDEEQLDYLKEKLEEFEDAEPIQKDIYQYFLIGTSNLYLFEEANELVLYSDKLDCYIWCVDHWGTSWSYVFTNIKIDEEKN